MFTGIDAMSWVPEYPIEEEKLWRITEGVKDIQFSRRSRSIEERLAGRAQKLLQELSGQAAKKWLKSSEARKLPGIFFQQGVYALEIVKKNRQPFLTACFNVMLKKRLVH